jgi:two-component system, OmpR family, response regulator VanR
MGRVASDETILLVDDESEILDLLEIYIRNEGYRVLRAVSGMEALAIVRDRMIDLVILDLMMPGMDGIQACFKIRETHDMPIIMLSAKTEDTDKILGLGTGADDYVTKPFNPLELIARIKSQLRRYRKSSAPTASEDEIVIDNLQMNVTTHEVKVDGHDIKLTPTEFDILVLLSRNPGVVFSTDRIYDSVWNESSFQSNNTVVVHIRKIREKIEKNPREPRYIKTVWGIGYKIEK